MKVCILTERMRIGFGVDLVVDEQAKRLAAMGFNVTVIVIHADINQPPRDYRLLVINRLAFAPDFGSEQKMRVLLTRWGVIDSDIWIAHTAPFYEWIRWLDAPMILLEYGTPQGSFFAPHIGNALDDYTDYRLNDLYHCVQLFDKIVSISHAIHDWLPSAIQSHSCVVYLGGDHYPTANPEKVERLRDELGVAGQGGVFLWVGRMQLDADEQPYKGFRELLAIAPKIVERSPGWKFVLAGRASDHDAAELRSQGFQVLANLDAEELATAMAAADVLVNVSRWEGFNLVLIEAPYQGTPVVAYDFGPHKEIVAPGRSGILASDVNGLIEGAVVLARDAALRRHLSIEGRKFAANFTWDENVAQLAATMRECLETAPPRDIVRLKRKEVMQTRVEPKAAQAQPQLQPPADRRWWIDCNNAEFVQQAFRVLLGREAEPLAVDGFSARLNCGESRAAVLADIRFSPEGASRQLDDPYLITLVASEFVRHARDPQLGLGDLHRNVDGVANEIRAIHAQLAALRHEADINRNLLAAHVSEENERVYAAVTQPSFDLIGRAAMTCVKHPEYALLVAANARVSKVAANEVLQFMGRESGDVIFCDERQIVVGASPRICVNGPWVEDNGAAALLGKCVFVRYSLLKRLKIDIFSVLTATLADRLIRHAETISYVPIVLSESAKTSEAAGARIVGAPAPLGEHLAAQTRLAACSDLAIVVAPFGKETAGDDWLHSIIEFAVGCSTVIVLVDDDERAALQEKVKRVTGVNVQFKSPCGDGDIMHAVNEAIGEARGVIALVDRNCAVASANALMTLAAQLSLRSIGVLSPLIVDSSGTLLNAGLAASHDELFAVVGQFFDPTQASALIPHTLDVRRQVTALAEGFVLFRWDTFERIGGFDATLSPTAATIDFCLQARAYGLSVMVDGRSAAVSSDPALRYGLTFNGLDALTLIARHGSWIANADEFWVERTSDGRAATIACLNTPARAL